MSRTVILSRLSPAKAQLVPLDELYRARRFDEVLAGCAALMTVYPHAAVLRLIAGLAYSGLRQYAAAIASYTEALALDPEMTSARYNMAIAHKAKGDLAGAIACYRLLLVTAPDHVAARYNLGNALDATGDTAGALACYKAVLERDPTHTKACSNLGGHYYDLGKRDAAIQLYQRVLRQAPDHPAATHLLAALTGNTPDTAPRQYVTEVFDDYATSFESSLIDDLGYRAPTQLADLLRRLTSQDSLGDVLDLGCGTGLMGAALAGQVTRLTGVDLSEPMLDQARIKGVYDSLIQADLLEHLATSELAHDHVVATDVLIYVGDLDPVFDRLAQRARRPMRFAFSTEYTPEAGQKGYVLRPSGRYAHSHGYIDALAARHGFDPVHKDVRPLRMERGAHLDGGIYVFDLASR